MMFFNKKKFYRISLGDEDWVTPEETLLDISSQHSDIEIPISDSLFKFLGGAFFFAIIIIIISAFNLSVLNHDYFARLSFQNKTVNFPLSAPRGIIFDRAGNYLVKNIPSFDLLVVSREARPIIKDREEDIKKIAIAVDAKEEEFMNKLNNEISSNAIFFIAKDISKEKALEVEYFDFPGFYIISSTKRNYLEGKKFSSVIGYVAKVDKNDLSDEFYFPTDSIGKLGAEAQYEEALRGKHGNIFFTLDKADEENNKAEPGRSLVLNIDKDMQIRLYDELQSILRESGLSKAAAIIQNPQNGEVLAMVSFPSYDNNIFNSSVSLFNFRRLFEDNNKPLFNRIISGLYNPGSTIKPFVGMAGLQEKVIGFEDIIQDCVAINIPNQFDSSIVYTFKNWRAEYGPFDMKRAIANSCNIYFFTVGGGFGSIKGLGAERLTEYFKQGMVDSKLSIDLPGEATGFVPTPSQKEEIKGEQWFLGDTYNISIGQGDLLVTPLWLNTYISAVANGGDIYSPMVANRIVDGEKKDIEIFKHKKIAELPFDDDVIRKMRISMRETTISGTARLLADLPVEVAAKTGTAEVIKGQSINSLFTGFAPYNNPEISITVLVEGSDSNQGYAIRIANNFLKWYFNRK